VHWRQDIVFFYTPVWPQYAKYSRCARMHAGEFGVLKAHVDLGRVRRVCERDEAEGVAVRKLNDGQLGPAVPLSRAVEEQ